MNPARTIRSRPMAAIRIPGRAATSFLHMAADAAVSLDVVLAGLGIIYTGWLWLDPTMSLAIAAVILWSTWGLFRDSFYLAMDRVPKDLSLPDIASYLGGLKGVADVHDLHVWAVSTTDTALTVHLVMPHPGTDAFLARVAQEVR